MDCTICATERSRREALSARCEARGGGILPEIASVAMRPSAVPGLADLQPGGHDSEAVCDAPVADPEVSVRHRGRCAGKPRLDVTRRRYRNLLVFLRLHRMCRGGRDARALAAVAGSDPPIRRASYGTAPVGMCTSIPPSPGALPVQQSRAGRPNGEPKRACQADGPGHGPRRWSHLASGGERVLRRFEGGRPDYSGRLRGLLRQRNRRASLRAEDTRP